MTTLQSLSVKLALDASQYTRGLREAERQADNSASSIVRSLGSIGSKLALGGIALAGAGIAALGAGLTASVLAASESEDVMAQLDATLRSTASAFTDTANAIPQISEEVVEALAEIQEEHEKTVDRINQNAEDSIRSVNDRIAELQEIYTEREVDRQRELARDIEDIQDDLADRLVDIAEDHQDRLQSINDQLADKSTSFEESREDRQLRLSDRIEDIERNAAKKRLDLQHDLWNAETEEESTAIKVKMAALDSETKAETDALKTRAARDEQRAKEKHDKEMAQLRAKLADEESEYAKQQERLKQQTDERLADVKYNFDREVEIAKRAYDRQVEDASEALAEIELRRQRSLDEAIADLADAKEDLKSQFTPLELGMVVNQPQVQASKEMILELADSFSQLTKFEDDAIIAAESLLLTFTNVGAGVFPDAVDSILDVAEALDMDLNSAAIMVGKALNDPIQGLATLRRAGIQFSDEQEKMIKSLVESGEIEKAQQIILSELQTQFGGVAEAAGQTASGQWTIFLNTLENIGETIGTALLPVLGEFARVLNTTLNDPKVQEGIQILAEKLGVIAGKVGEFVGNLVTTGMKDALALAFGEETRKKIESVSTTINDLVEKAKPWIAAAKDIASKAAEFARDHGPALKASLVAILAVLAGAGVITVVAGLISALASPIGLIVLAVGALAFAWTENWGGIQEKAQGVLDVLTYSFTIWKDGMEDLFELFDLAFSGQWEEFGEKLREKWDEFWEAIKGVATAIWDWFLEQDWGEIGRNIVQGITNGIINAAYFIYDAIRFLVNSIVSAIKGFFGISSPSELMRKEVGLMLGEGVKLGMAESLTGLDVPSVSKITSVKPIFVNLQYAPMMSMADKYEVETRLLPHIESGLRRVMANG